MRLVEPIDAVVARARAGEAEAFRQLYEAHVDAVYGYCLAFCRGDRATAADLCQDSFTRALSSLDSLRSDQRFSGWLMTITRRTCLRWIERRQREQRALSDLSAEPPRLPDNPRDRAARVVSEVIEACPDEGLRRAARLFYTDPPHSTASIGRHLGISRTAVTTRLHRFRAWARRRMLGQLAAALEGDL